MSEPHRGRLAWLGIEPTPYLLALQDRARNALPLDVESVFERRDASQPWGLPSTNWEVLTSVAAKARFLLGVLTRRYRAVLLEGWGSGWLAAAGVTALVGGVPLVVSGDTWQAAGTNPFGPRRWIRRLLLDRAAATLPGGSRQRAFFLSEGADEARSVVRHMTVNVGSLQRRAAEFASERAEIRASLGLPRHLPVAITVARLVPEKGIDLLLSALKEVADLRLLVVGDGPQRPELESLAAGLGVADRVVWAGRLAHEDVVKAYVAADIFVLASRFEPWGLVVNEAMACGLPVVVSSAAGCVDDLVTGTGAGVVVPAGDAVSLTQALADLLRNSQLRVQMAAQARVTIGRWGLAEEIAAIRRALEVAVAG